MPQSLDNQASRETNQRFGRMKGTRPFLSLLAWTIVVTVASTAVGQSRNQSKLVVDVIHLKNQRPIRGFVLSGDQNEDMMIAVTKSWLEKHDQNAFSKAEESAKQQSIRAKHQLWDRLKALLNEPAPVNALGKGRNGALDFFLQKELERIKSEINNPQDDSFQFLVLRIKPSNVSNLILANDTNRRIAIWSWHERLQNVELRAPSNLTNELATKKIDASVEPPELDTRFYDTEESADQWTVRLALVTHRLDTPIEFQGSGDVMHLVGNGKPLDLASLLTKMMQSQMNSLIQDLTGGSKKPLQLNREEEDWIKCAMVEAEKMNANYFRATCVRLDPMATSASVDSAFLVKLPSGKWTVVWQAIATQSPDQQKNETIKRLENDPLVKSIQKQAEAFGGTASMEQALKIGAATMTAQADVNVKFQTFVERYLKQLSKPPIRLAARRPAD